MDFHFFDTFLVCWPTYGPYDPYFWYVDLYMDRTIHISWHIDVAGGRRGLRGLAGGRGGSPGGGAGGEGFLAAELCTLVVISFVLRALELDFGPKI